MNVRHLAVSLLLCLASPLAYATFPASVKWVHLGTSASNPCLAEYYPGGPCLLFESALEAGLANQGTGIFCAAPGTPAYFNGTFPNEYWTVGNFYANANCTGGGSHNFVKQVSLACPVNSTPSGNDCDCDTGYYEVDGAHGKSCQTGGDKNVPCPGCGKTYVVGNPINPATGNKFQRQEIYRSAHGLDFSGGRR